MVNTLTMRFIDSFAKSLEVSEEHMLKPVLNARVAAPEATANGHSIGPVAVETPTEPVQGFVLPSSL
jgi:hypothetical protein